jgi:integrase/recombinase XerD
MERYITDKCALLRMRVGPLEPFLNSFSQQLNSKGYTRDTARYQIRMVAAFSKWLQSKSITVTEIENEHAECFLGQRTQRARRGDASILNCMLDMLRLEGVAAKRLSPVKPTPVEDMTAQFARYLRQERGLASSTIVHYARLVRSFLFDQYSAEPVDCSSLTLHHVVDFVQRQAKVLPQKEAQFLTTALRSFFQYARYQGFMQSDLAVAVPTVPSWSMSGIPKAIPLVHIELVLSSCNRTTVGGRRDYAILLLLARLGLRAGEIVSLKLDDIDWHNGCITVRGKGGSYCQLPLPIDVGEAVADYLKNGRPKHSSRSLFLRETAPIAGFRDQQAIGSVVRRALARAGIDAPRKGGHQFRHALATDMLRRGASLEEIGEILRHRLPSTTAIYAKVDLVALRELAMPWPGGV